MYNRTTAPMILVDGRIVPGSPGGISERHSPIAVADGGRDVSKDKIDLSLEMSGRIGTDRRTVKAWGLRNFHQHATADGSGRRRVEFASNGIRIHEMIAEHAGWSRRCGAWQGVLTFKETSTFPN